MHINDIYEQVVLYEKSHTKDDDLNTFKPEFTYDYEVPELKINEKFTEGRLTKNFISVMSKVYAFISCVQRLRMKEVCTIMPIPTWNHKYVSICGSPMSVSNLIKYMMDMGLISIENETYRFASINSKDNHSRTYRYYYENEQKVIEYCKLHDI